MPLLGSALLRRLVLPGFTTGPGRAPITQTRSVLRQLQIATRAYRDE